MAKRPLISVVIPNYNDAEVVESFYTKVKTHLEDQTDYDFEIIYVDDGSTDHSVKLLEKLDPHNPKFRFVELYRNYGQQRALFVGLKITKGDFVVTIDGDEQYSPKAITQLVDKMGQQYEMASGIRAVRQDSWFGRKTSQIGKYLINNIIGIKIKDFGSVKSFSRSLVDRVKMNDNYNSDVYAAALSLHPSLVEVPSEHFARKIGKSHWSLSKRVQLYLNLYVKYGDDQFALVFNCGALMMITAVVLSVVMSVWKIIAGHQESLFVILMTAIMIGISGLMLLGWSVIASLIIKLYNQDSLSSDRMVRKIHVCAENNDNVGKSV
tara:strand:- start:17207 stop:18175 length:969 start_codon:yes stop_codon:yes gene_type:complete